MKYEDVAINGLKLWPVSEMSAMSKNNGITVSQTVITRASHKTHTTGDYLS